MQQNQLDTPSQPSFGALAVGMRAGEPRELLELRASFAVVIDQLHAIRCNPSAGPEQKRVASIAITEAEGACMWAVKALTKKG